MAQPSYYEILKRNNPGVYIEEKNNSVYSITPFFNRFTLVIGSSKDGPINMPVLVVSPENFEEIFGKHDYLMERKKSYFHRTVKNLLTEGPVICINLRITDDTDRYSWQSFSLSCIYENSKTRSSNISSFYNIGDGFWKRSPEELTETSKYANPEYNDKPLNFVNMGTKKVSLLMRKSPIAGFDITAEDWYGGASLVPEYIHPKDLISDYMIEVTAVQGDWNNYEKLSLDPVWGTYFTKDGIKKDKIELFINNSNINTLKRWQCSMIPYFTDKNGKDMHIESVINEDINETKLLCSLNTEAIEDAYRNGRLDLIGDGLVTSRKPLINFLSYKEYISDFYMISESQIDTQGNSFGNHLYNSNTRTQIYSEGYVNNVQMKPLIISTTTSIEVRPLSVSGDSYAVMNGKKIPLNYEIKDYIALHERVQPNYQTVYACILTDKGIDFRFGNMTTIDTNAYLPEINPLNEMVLGYYLIKEDSNFNFYTEFFPVTLDENGFINPFGNGIEVSEGDYQWTQLLRFSDIKDVNNQDYVSLRLYHLWNYLSENLEENVSMAIDTNGLKQKIKWLDFSNDNSDRTIKISIEDKTAVIDGSTNGMVSYYMNDVEFLSKNDRWENQKYPLSFGDNGIIGYDSILETAYYNGDINSGDPFFWGLSEEDNVEFLYDDNIKQNLMILPNKDVSQYLYKKIVIKGTYYNDGLRNFLGSISYGDRVAVVMKEEAVSETIDSVYLFDGETPMIINLYNQGSGTVALVESWDGSPEELYRNIYGKNPEAQWAETLDIKEILNKNKVLVDWNRYSDKLEKGYSLLADPKAYSDYKSEKKKNWTRITDLQLNESGMLEVETDAPIFLRYFDGYAQTDILKPIDTWVTTLDFKVLDGSPIRKESLPDGTEHRLQDLLNIIHPNTKLFESIAGDKLQWRYLVDSYGGGNYNNSKYQLAMLSEQKKFAMSFINMPSISTLKKDGSKYTTNRSFDVDKLINGGDRKNNTGSSYSYYNSSYACTVAPYVSVYDNGRFYKVPPASFVASSYMKKFNDGKLKIWEPVCGINNGYINYISGTEYNFSNDDLIKLNNYGIIPITNINNNYFLYNENTSDGDGLLKSAHNREALIELELSIYKNMLQYQWVSLDVDIKKKIEDKANEICNSYKKNKAIKSFRNVFTYTDDSRDKQIGILNTYVEMVGNMKTIVLRVNIN